MRRLEHGAHAPLPDQALDAILGGDGRADQPLDVCVGPAHVLAYPKTPRKQRSTSAKASDFWLFLAACELAQRGLNARRGACGGLRVHDALARRASQLTRSFLHGGSGGL